MPLEAIGPMIRRAVETGYAIGYFESWNLESLQGVVDAAEQTCSPIILGFNGALPVGSARPRRSGLHSTRPSVEPPRSRRRFPVP